MNLEDDILIAQFFKKELSVSKREEVLKRIQIDAVFRDKVLSERQFFESLDEKEWRFLKDIQDSEIKAYEALFRSKEVQQLETVFSDANTRYKRKHPAKKRKWFLYSSVASIALLIAVLIFNSSNNNTTETLYYQYLDTTEIPSITNRGNILDYEALSKGEAHFKNKEYNKAKSIFLKAKKDTTINSTSYLFLAVSQIETQDYKAAEEALNILINGNSLNADKGYWYKALLYLKNKQIAKAKTTLQVIINNSYYKNKEAIKLLHEIEKL